MLVYGFKNYNEIISFFGRELKLNIEKCLTILLCQAIIQKNGQVLSLVDTNSKAFKKQIARSIRAIAENWTINFQEEMDERIIGFFTQEEIIRGGLPGNIILINKMPYLVKSFNSKRRKIGVGLVSIPTTNQSLASNVLTSPKIMMGLFPKKRRLSSGVTLQLGELTVTKRPKLIVKFSLNDSKNSFQYFPPTDSEKIAYAFIEKSFGLLVNIAEVFQDPLLSLFASKTKEMLACLALVLKTQIELTLQIPQSELAIAYNESQFAIYDRGGENGNVQQVFKELQLVFEQAINRLEGCSCLDGCEKCYGRDFTKLLPQGKSKMILKQLITWLME